MPTNNNFLVPITAPQLQNPNFQSEFDEFCSAIHDNFERLISVQYARGERGTSIESHEVHFIENGDNGWVLTEFGAEFLNKLFTQLVNGFGSVQGIQGIQGVQGMPGESLQLFTAGMDKDAVLGLLDILAPPVVVDEQEPERTKHVINWEAWKTLSVVIFVDPDSETAYIGNPYIFIDNRINDLPNYVQILNENPNWEFTDYSCMYTGFSQYPSNNPPMDFNDYSNWPWDGRISQVVPKLYYDENNKEFCWKVNGQETQITAQGLKGDPGISTAVHVCQGHVTGQEKNYLTIDLAERIDYTADPPQRYWDEYDADADPEDNAYMAIRNNDLIICYYEAPDDGETADRRYWDGTSWRAFIGRAIRVNNEIWVWMGSDPESGPDPRLDIFYTIWNQTVADILNSTGYDGSNTENQPRGIWVKDSTDDGNNGVLHMLYVDWVTDGEGTHSRRVLRISPVKTAQGTCDTVSPEVHPHSSPEDDGYDFEIDYNIKAQRDLHVQGNTIVQNLTVQGTLDQQGQIQTDLNIAGELIDVVTHQRPDIEKSEFAKCCISNVEDAKTYVTATRLSYGTMGLTQLSETIGGDPIGDHHWDINQYSAWSNQPVFKAYVGVSFNLHLIIGYMGFGKLIADASIYSRDGQNITTFNWETGAQGVIGMTRQQVNNRCALYNAREYVIPCHMYQELLIGWNPTDNVHGFQTRDDISNLPSETLINLTYEATPINYEGQFIYPRITFDAWVRIQDVTDGNMVPWDSSGRYPSVSSTGSTDEKKSKFNIFAIFYQGTVDASNNQAFGLTDNGGGVDTRVINQSRVSCLYGTGNSTTSATYPKVNQFAPLWPYQICEMETTNALNWGISDQDVWVNRTGLLIRNLEQSADTRKEQYKQYIYNVAYPRMCALGAGTLGVVATKTQETIDQQLYQVVRYSTDFNEEMCKSQSYISFFNNGMVDSNGTPIWTDQSIEIRRVFRLDDMWVFTGNMNIFYKRLNLDNGTANDMQTLIDDDIANVGIQQDYDDQQNQQSNVVMAQWMGYTNYTAMQIGGTIDKYIPARYVPLTNTNKYTNGDEYPHILGHSNLHWVNQWWSVDPGDVTPSDYDWTNGITVVSGLGRLQSPGTGGLYSSVNANNTGTIPNKKKTGSAASLK